VFGISIVSARCLGISMITGIAVVTYLASYRASRHAAYSGFMSLMWTMMAQGYFTQVSHHWLTTLLSMVAIWLALAPSDRPMSPFIAGLAAGAGAMVTPTRGVLALIAAVAGHVGAPRNALLARLVLGTSVVPVLMLMYLISQGSLIAGFEDVIVFPAHKYAG